MNWCFACLSSVCHSPIAHKFAGSRNVVYWPARPDHVHYDVNGAPMNVKSAFPSIVFVALVTTADGRYRGNWQVTARSAQDALEAVLNSFKAIKEGDIIRLNSCSESGLSHIDNYVAAKPVLRAEKRPNDNMPEWDINGNQW